MKLFSLLLVLFISVFSYSCLDAFCRYYVSDINYNKSKHTITFFYDHDEYYEFDEQVDPCKFICEIDCKNCHIYEDDYGYPTLDFCHLKNKEMKIKTIFKDKSSKCETLTAYKLTFDKYDDVWIRDSYCVIDKNVIVFRLYSEIEPCRIADIGGIAFIKYSIREKNDD